MISIISSPKTLTTVTESELLVPQRLRALAKYYPEHRAAHRLPDSAQLPGVKDDQGTPEEPGHNHREGQCQEWQHTPQGGGEEDD